jgi:uncharacterized protein YqeY
MGDTDGMTSPQELQDDLTAAIRARDELRAATIRMVLAALAVERTAGTVARDLTDEDVQLVLRKEAKKRREAAAAFDAAGRHELAERERAEEQVLADYLPAPLDDAAVARIVEAAVEAAALDGATGPSAMGAVMRRVQAEVAGRADGRAVAEAVRARLTQS